MFQTPEKLNTPKTYWKTRRVEGHADWSFDFWRELFQNSLDAGAKNINISMIEDTGKGSFGRPAKTEKVIRVIFEDDGKGMDENILRNVFLSPGESTKKNGETVGGFGTARIMLCFSQDRYSVKTNGLNVEGDGSEYIINENNDDIIRGCKMEIDIDPNEFDEYWKNTNLNKLRDHLYSFLSYSDIKHNIIFNGNSLQYIEKTTKGRYKRELFIEQDKSFAKVYTTSGQKALHKGEIIVRVNGVVMFTSSADIKEQVVIEINPEMSREVLLDNRDGMKRKYQSVLNDFLNELSVNTLSALKEENTKKHIEILGKGKKNNFDFLKNIENQTELSEIDKKILEETLVNFKSESNEESTEIKNIIRLAQENTLTLDYLKQVPVEILEKINAKSKSYLRNSDEDMYDVHIQIDDTTDKNLVALSKRYYPTYWRKKGEENQGRGRKAAILLAAWTSFCDEAIQSLNVLYPQKVINYTTGWYFGKPESLWDGDEYKKQRTRAQHQQKDDNHILLLNPVLENGKMAFDVNDTGGFKRDKGEDTVSGLQALETLALHEVSHIIHSRHNESFASLFTELSSLFNRSRAHENAKKSINAVLDAFGYGDSIIQSLDEDTVVPKITRKRKIRPAEKLLAHAMPITTAITGLLTSNENSHLQTNIGHVIEQNIVTNNGVTVVNCDALQKLENDMKDKIQVKALEIEEDSIPDIDFDFDLEKPIEPITQQKDESEEILGEEISSSLFKI
jgi:hypothetical protein